MQGIGMALTENVTYNDRGMPRESSLMQYKIPCRTDIGHIDVSFESSYEGTGPFGAKSIGEVVINTPLPAVADAIYHNNLRFWLSSYRTSLAVSALRIMRYCPIIIKTQKQYNSHNGQARCGCCFWCPFSRGKKSVPIYFDCIVDTAIIMPP